MQPDVLVELVSKPSSEMVTWKPSPASSFGFIVHFGPESFSAARLSDDTSALLSSKSTLSELAFLVRRVVEPHLKIGTQFQFWESRLSGSGKIIEVYGREWRPFDALKTRIAKALVGTSIDLLLETEYESFFGSAEAVYGQHLADGQQVELFRVTWDGRDGWAVLRYEGIDGALQTIDPLWTLRELRSSTDWTIGEEAFQTLLGKMVNSQTHSSSNGQTSPNH